MSKIYDIAILEESYKRGEPPSGANLASVLENSAIDFSRTVPLPTTFTTTVQQCATELKVKGVF